MKDVSRSDMNTLWSCSKTEERKNPIQILCTRFNYTKLIPFFSLNTWKNPPSKKLNESTIQKRLNWFRRNRCKWLRTILLWCFLTLKKAHFWTQTASINPNLGCAKSSQRANKDHIWELFPEIDLMVEIYSFRFGEIFCETICEIFCERFPATLGGGSRGVSRGRYGAGEKKLKTPWEALNMKKIQRHGILCVGIIRGE